jgi:hypothetical protein
MNNTVDMASTGVVTVAVSASVALPPVHAGTSPVSTPKRPRDASRVRSVHIGAPDLTCDLLDLVMCLAFSKRTVLKGVDATGTPLVYINRDTNHMSMQLLTPDSVDAAFPHMLSARESLCKTLCKFGKRAISPWRHSSVLGTFAILCHPGADTELDFTCKTQRACNKTASVPTHGDVHDDLGTTVASSYTLMAHDLALETPLDLMIAFEIMAEFLPVALAGVHSIVLPKTIYGLLLLVRLKSSVHDTIVSLHEGTRAPLYAEWFNRPSPLAEMTLCPRGPRFVGTVFPTSAAGLITVMESLLTRTRVLQLDWYTGKMSMTTDEFVLELYTQLHRDTDTALSLQINTLIDRIAHAFPRLYARAHRIGKTTSIRICGVPAASGIGKAPIACTCRFAEFIFVTCLHDTVGLHDCRS